jgi:hypothetical protein
MAARSYLCIDPTGRGLRAVLIAVEGDRATVERAAVASMPPETDPQETEVVARWIVDTLRSSGFALGSAIHEVIVVIDREQATIRRLSLPTDDVDELPDMARFAIQRETPPEAGALAVDLVPRESVGGTTMVVVAAAPSVAVERARLVADAIAPGTPVVGLRAFGVARLLSDASAAASVTPPADGPGVVAAFDCSGETLELVVVRGGEILYSRGVRVADAAAAASEAKRSWMGYRFTQADEQLSAAYLLASESWHAEFGAALDRALGMPLVAFVPPATLRVASTVDREALGACWSLVGLALERSGLEESINLAAPRRAPDRAARRRMRALAAAGALVVAGLLGWTMGSFGRERARTEVEALTAEATAKLPSHFRYRRDALKLEHLRAWESAGPEWLEEFRFIHGFAPDSTKVVLDSLQASLEASDVQYDRSKRWKIAADLKFAMTGEARDRATADALRDALVEDGRFTVTSTGADTEGGRRLASPFTYVLRGPVRREPERSQKTGESKESAP